MSGQCAAASSKRSVDPAASHLALCPEPGSQAGQVPDSNTERMAEIGMLKEDSSSFSGADILGFGEDLDLAPERSSLEELRADADMQLMAFGQVASGRLGRLDTDLSSPDPLPRDMAALLAVTSVAGVSLAKVGSRAAVAGGPGAQVLGGMLAGCFKAGVDGAVGRIESRWNRQISPELGSGDIEAFVDELSYGLWDGIRDACLRVHRTDDRAGLEDFVWSITRITSKQLAEDVYVEVLKLWTRYAATATATVDWDDPERETVGDAYQLKLFVSLTDDGYTVERASLEGLPQACRDRLLDATLDGIPLAIIGVGRGSAGFRADIDASGMVEDRSTDTGALVLEQWGVQQGYDGGKEAMWALVEELRGRPLSVVAPDVALEGQRGVTGELSWMMGR